MRAMVLERPKAPLVLEDRPRAEPGPNEVRVRVSARGVCRTDLHVCDGEELLTLAPKMPVETSIETFPLEQANEALRRLRAGELRGAARRC